MQYVWKKDEGNWKEVEKGVKRKVIARGKNMMLAYLKFEKGAGSVESFHQHKHVQATYVLSGKFIFNVDGKKYEVEKGDSLYNPSNKPHTAVCLEDGELLDVFYPNRLEYLLPGESSNEG